MNDVLERATDATYHLGEALTLKLTGDEPPTGWRRALLRFPVTLYRWRLDALVSQRILLLRTVGRRTGRVRVTPLEYLHDGATDTYYLMAGWGGRTDWIRNLRADPRVRIRVGRRELAREARILGAPEGGVVLQRWIGRTPSLVPLLERDTGLRYDGTLASSAEIASRYAVVALPPDDGSDTRSHVDGGGDHGEQGSDRA